MNAPNECRVYAMYAIDGTLAPIQAAQFAEYYPECAYQVVEDGYYPCKTLSLPSVRLKTASLSPPSGTRSIALADAIFRTLVPEQKEPFALVVHGDMMPVKQFSMQEILSNRRYAACGAMRPNDTRRHWTTQMLGVDLRQGPLERAWWQWNPADVNVLHVQTVWQEGRNHFEWIGPFLHFVAMNTNLVTSPFYFANVPPYRKTGCKNNTSHSCCRQTVLGQPVQDLVTSVVDEVVDSGEDEKTYANRDRYSRSDKTRFTDKFDDSHIVPPELIEARVKCCLTCRRLRGKSKGIAYCSLHTRKDDGSYCERLGIRRWNKAIHHINPWCKPWRKIQ